MMQLSVLLLLPYLAMQVLAVEIQLRGPTIADPQRVQLCENILADQCCQGALGGPSGRIFQFVYANNLPLNAFIGTWRAGRGQEGCAGANVAIGLGPGRWFFDATTARASRVTGANWIQCPDAGANTVFDRFIAGMCAPAARHFRGLITRKEPNPDAPGPRGNYHVYPNKIIIDNITYSDDHRGDKIYKDAAGHVLDLDAYHDEV